jgi:hypothetical protein
MMRATLLLICPVIFFIGLANLSCNREGEKPVERKPIEEVLKRHTDHLMSIEGVVGTGIGESDGKPCIKVLVVKKTEELQKEIPTELEGYKVVIDETGEIRALEKK